MRRVITCPECGLTFVTEDHRRRYCSAKCRRKAGRYKEILHEEQEGVPVLREFTCKNCGRLVRVTERSDRRSSFCSVACERAARHGIYEHRWGKYAAKKSERSANSFRSHQRKRQDYMSDTELEQFLSRK